MVSGKAVVLDEIINYVQSLQHQVELATMNPQFDFDTNYLQHKEMNQVARPVPSQAYVSGVHNETFSYENGCYQDALDTAFPQRIAVKLPPLEGFGDASSQIGAFLEQDLQAMFKWDFCITNN